MKTLLAVAATVAIAAIAIPTHRAAAQGGGKGDMPMKMAAPASHHATIIGTVVDVSCKFGQGLSGKERRHAVGCLP